MLGLFCRKIREQFNGNEGFAQWLTALLLIITAYFAWQIGTVQNNINTIQKNINQRMEKIGSSAEVFGYINKGEPIFKIN